MPGEGKFIALYWPGDIVEWQLLGASYRLKELPPTPQGTLRTSIDLSFHVARQSTFYIFKLVTPVMLFGLLCFSAFEFNVTDKLSVRLGITATYFMASLAMLAATSTYLPRTDYLTQMDKTIAATMSLNAFVGINTRITAYIARHQGADVAARVDDAMQPLLALLYIGGVSALLLPAWSRRQRAIANLSSEERVANEDGYVKLDTVDDGQAYVPKSGLLPSAKIQFQDNTFYLDDTKLTA